ncbi:MAG: helix-turn-helix domain-containing protein [Ktedonobacteraceae bacterium]|nr:helix-turn-helix domain-containing protein [Ktedonobacteraceae bacterium]
MEPLITSDEVAAFLRVDVVTIRRLVNRKELPAYRIGNEYRFSREDLDAYLRQQRTVSNDEPGGNPFMQWMQKNFFKGREQQDRFGRFTEKARRVISYSQEEARIHRHNYVGTEHLLLGLLRVEDSIACRALSNLGVKLEEVREAVGAIIGRGEEPVVGENRLTPRAQRVIELAVKEARTLDHDYLGTEHILLGLIHEGEGIACGVLKEKLGLRLKQVYEEVLRLVEEEERAGGYEKGVLAGGDRFKRFTEKARRVISYSQEEARNLQHDYVGTEHLLMGLLHEKEGIAFKALHNLGIQLEMVCEGVLSIVGRGDHVVTGEIGLTKRTKKVFELAVEEARSMQVDYVGTEHLLLGLLREGEGLACQVLKGLGQGLEQVREEVLRVLKGPELPVVPVPGEAVGLLAEGEDGLTCERCGARSPRYFRHCFHCGSALQKG